MLFERFSKPYMSIAESFDRVVKRQKTLGPELENLVDSMIASLTSYSASSETKHLLEVKKLGVKMSDNCKDFSAVLSKCSKTVEKKIKGDLDTVWDPKALNGKEQIVYNTLLQHFIREGRFDLAETFAKEAGLDLDEKLSKQFMEMFWISKALRDNNADLAIEWAKSNSKALNASGSCFTFRLHQFKYLQLVRAQNIQGALVYAQEHFHQFSGKHMKGNYLSLETNLLGTLYQLIF